MKISPKGAGMDVYVLCGQDGRPVSVHRRRQGADAASADLPQPTSIINFDLQDDDEDA